MSESLFSLLQDGERCLSEARLSLRRSLKLKDMLQEEGHRLVEVLSLMQAQVRSIAELLQWCWHCNSSLSGRIEALLAQDKPFIHIDEICHQLESTKVDAELVAGEQGHSLFDFVDDRSVSSLKLQAQVDLKEMLALHEKGVSAQTVLEERLFYFQQFISTLQEALGAPFAERLRGRGGSKRLVLEECGIWWMAMNNTNEQAEIIEKMKAGLLVAASAYSRTRQDSSTPGGGVERARSPASEERELLALLQASIHRMKDLHLQMDRMPQRIHTLRQQMRALLADFDSFHPEAAERISALKDDQQRFSGLAENVHNHLQELASLAAFYSHFSAAYSHLGSEIVRRRRALEQAAQVIKEAQENLNRLHDDEEAARARFYQQYGRYLPASLCPVIQDPPDRFVIRPDVHEVMTKLPVVGSALMASPHHQPRKSIVTEAEERGVIDLPTTRERPPFGKKIAIEGGNPSKK